MKRSILPEDSCIHGWLDGMAITEVPLSYQIVCGVSAIGAVLRRNVYINQEWWKVYPNLSVLMIGPSGIGKDTVIDQVIRILENIASTNVIAGRTIETIYTQMLELGNPACCVIPAREVSAFFGGKDYQKGMVQELTDLLSTGSSVDVSLKGTGKQKIMGPTVTMLAGSTLDWLHKAMPDGSLEGGLWPRFLIIYEEYGSRYVPLVKYSLTKVEQAAAHRGMSKFEGVLKKLAGKYAATKEFVLLQDAQDLYVNWYENRMKYFSPAVRPYANRSRDQVLRLALICAVSRGVPYIEARDIQFGIDILFAVAETIDKAVQPPSMECRIGDVVLKMLPATSRVLLMELGRKYPARFVKEAIGFLAETGQMKLQGTKWVNIKEKD